jgi:MOSC domain-containing protein YiiM
MILADVLPRVFAGRVMPLGEDGRVSAIDKRPVSGPWGIGVHGLVNDSQANRTHHGGPEKALHHYPLEHYTAWIDEIGAQPLLAAPGAFGENLSTQGWTEETICIGDVVRFGAARLQVSQGRQPCLTLNLRFGLKDMALRVQKNGRSGWYYRVLEPGVAKEGDALQLIDRPRSDWTLARLNKLLYHDVKNRTALTAMAEIAELSSNWRDLARRRLSSGKTEDWSRRLYGRDAAGL